MQTLEAPEGKYLTQAAADTPDGSRIYCTTVALSALDSADSWREATAEEKEEFEARQEAAALAAMEADGTDSADAPAVAD